MSLSILLTGKPGSGKSTLLLSVIERLKDRKIAGIITPEIRVGGSRHGFRIIDLCSKEERILSSTTGKGPRVGKYYVNVANIDAIVGKFQQSADSAEIIVIDEIGKMELFSEKFKHAVDKAFSSDKKILAVVHRSLASRYRNKGTLIVVEKDKVDKLRTELLSML